MFERQFQNEFYTSHTLTFFERTITQLLESARIFMILIKSYDQFTMAL